MARTKGSKNKSTIEKEKQEALAKEQEVKVEESTQDTPETQETQPELTIPQQLELMVFGEDLMNFQGIEFTLKKYLPISEKEDFINLVVENCFQESGFTHIVREMMAGYNYLTYYTDIDFGDMSVTDIYDLSKQSGLLDFVKRNIPHDEINFLEKEITQAIKSKRPEYDNKQSFAEIIGDFLNRMNENVPNAINELKGFDPSKLGNIMEVLDKFDKFNNPGKVTPMNREQRRAMDKKKN